MTNSKKKDQGPRIPYESPKLFDLGGGGVAYAQTQTQCKPGGSPGGEQCKVGTTATANKCSSGGAAGSNCKSGGLAAGGDCKFGNSAAGNCKAGGTPGA
ncbi:MAG: hypothetical protein JRF06_04205 [Deltaproteobacteria bacterium]|nr:hypothetical protein [Deltaproteobacteria bacterium]